MPILHVHHCVHLKSSNTKLVGNGINYFSDLNSKAESYWVRPKTRCY
jgi:hypothetical protein